MYLKGRNGYFFKSFCQILNYRNLKMCDVRLNDNIKRTSGINREGPSLIRRSRKVWAPPKKWSNCANGYYQLKLNDFRSVFVMAMVPQLVTMLLHMNPSMTMAHPWHQFMEHPQEAATAARNAIVEPSIPNLKSKRRRTRSVTAFVMDMGLLLLAMVLPPTITRLHQLDTGPR